MHYTYDSETPTVPSEQLKVYSLKEDILLRQAISAYQIKNPDIYVDYQIGIEENSSVTREDALKKLNTEIVAGTGPDLILLDDMPIDSYIDKGILLDLSPYLEEIIGEEDVFTNVVNTFKTDSGTYAVPTQFTLPLMAGNSEKLQHIKDLKGLADVVDQIRKEKEEGFIIGAKTEEALISILLSSCAPSWKTEAGKINESALTEFFTYGKQIWETESKGFTDAIKNQNLEELKSWEEMKEQGATDDELRQMYQYMQPLGIPLYNQILCLGELSGDYSLDMLTSLFKQEEIVDGSFSTLNMQSKNVYIPKTIIGINSKSANAQEAVNLLDILIGKDCISGEMSFSINKKIWDDTWNEEKENNEDALSTMGVSTQDGVSFYMTVYPSTQADANRLREMGDAATTPYIRDAVLENAVYEVGTSILNGEKTVEDGVAEIVKKLAIYMAE